MSNLKKYLKYILLIIFGYILTSVLVFIGFNSNYSPITLQGNLPEQMSIEKAEAISSEARIYGYIENKQENNVNGKYIVATIYNSENEIIAVESLEISGVDYGTRKLFRMNINVKNATSYSIEILEE